MRDDDVSMDSSRGPGDSLPMPQFPIARAILKTNRADGNLLDCALLDKDGNERGTVVVARPPELQTAYYDGETIDSVAYAFVDNTSRTADSDTHEIVPSYVEDSTILLIAKLRGGTGLLDESNQSLPVVWQEIGFRGWGKTTA